MFLYEMSLIRCLYRVTDLPTADPVATMLLAFNVLSESINNTTTIPLHNPDEKEIGNI